MPVTLKAQQSEEYQDYLSREGEDNNLYYDIKLQASKLLIDNTENTFVTPVFNGSASLRNAAGQMIENVTKSVRRGETIDADYMETLYSDVTALYRLDQNGEQSSAAGKTDLGKLPGMAVGLLTGLAVVWSLIGLYLLREQMKKKAKNTI